MAERADTDLLVASLTVVLRSTKADLIWGELMAQGKATGPPRSAMDTIVAAVAQANGCNVVTDNEGEFQGIEIIKPRNLNACQTPIVVSRHRSARSTGVARRAGTSDFSISTISSSQWCQQIFAHGLLSPGARDLPRTLLSRARVFQAKLTARFWLTAALEGRWRARLRAMEQSSCSALSVL